MWVGKELEEYKKQGGHQQNWSVEAKRKVVGDEVRKAGSGEALQI